MPVDKFGRMSDLKTKDTGVSLTYINNNYVRSDGETPLTGSLNMRGNTIYNVADPVNPQDVVTKVYVDNTKGSGVIGRKVGDAVSIKENLDFLGKQKIKNLPDPVNDHDAVTKEYVDDLQNQYIDKRGNIKFDRNINVGNHRIFAVKDPKKDYEATNKKYVDDTITKRLQEEKDNFLPQDPATKEYVDEAIKQVAGGDILVSKEGVFIKANGHYRATASLDIDNHKMENLPDPVDDKDAVNKKYIDGIIENLTLKQGLIRENGGFNLVDSYINMNFNNIRNLGLPKNENDGVPRKFVDDMIKEVEEKFKNQFKEIDQLIGVSASCYENLKYYDYPFTFGGPILNRNIFNLDKYNGFLVPADGFIKHFTIKSSGLIINIPSNMIKTNDIIKGDKIAYDRIRDLYNNEQTKLFNLIKIGIREREEIIGSVIIVMKDSLYAPGFALYGLYNDKNRYMSNTLFEFRPNPKYLNVDKNFICPVKRGDIINIRSEYTESIIPDGESFISEGEYIRAIYCELIKREKLIIRKTNKSLHLATLTFSFKEMSFPDISNLDPL